MADYTSGLEMLQGASSLSESGVAQFQHQPDSGIFGTSNVQGIGLWGHTSLVDRVLGSALLSEQLGLTKPPVALNQIKPPKSFRVGQPFTPQDLWIDVLAVNVSYAVYRIQQGCTPRLIGQPKRTPGKIQPSRYYVTGFAGECGQPGLWLIKWCIQKTLGPCCEERCCYFTVVDSVLSPVEGDTLPRTRKYGWF